MAGCRLPQPQYAPKYYQPMLATANDFIGAYTRTIYLFLTLVTCVLTSCFFVYFLSTLMWFSTIIHTPLHNYTNNVAITLIQTLFLNWYYVLESEDTPFQLLLLVGISTSSSHRVTELLFVITVQQQAFQNQLNAQSTGVGPLGLGLGLGAPLQPALPPSLLQQQNMLGAQNLALNQNLMGHNLGQNLGMDAYY